VGDWVDEDPGSGMGTENLGMSIKNHSSPNHFKRLPTFLIQAKITAIPQDANFLLTKLAIFGKMEL